MLNMNNTIIEKNHKNLNQAFSLTLSFFAFHFLFVKNTFYNIFLTFYNNFFIHYCPALCCVLYSFLPLKAPQLPCVRCTDPPWIRIYTLLRCDENIKCVFKLLFFIMGKVKPLSNQSMWDFIFSLTPYMILFICDIFKCLVLLKNTWLQS